jgi:uncharacterized protein
MPRTMQIPVEGAKYDLGLRRFFLNTMMVMSVGLGITALISLWISHDAATMNALFHLTEVMEDGELVTRPTMSSWWIAAAILQFVIVWRLAGMKVSRYGPGMSYAIFFVYSALTGVTIAPALYAYTDASVAMVFFITAAMFCGCAIVGHTTKINLRPFGTFFLMGLIGLIVAMLVCAVFRSPAMDYAVAILGVLLFAGLTAWDMQVLEDLYDEMGASDELIVYGALTLYLDFINLLLLLLRLFGKRD